MNKVRLSEPIGKCGICGREMWSSKEIRDKQGGCCVGYCSEVGPVRGDSFPAKAVCNGIVHKPSMRMPVWKWRNASRAEC